MVGENQVKARVGDDSVWSDELMWHALVQTTYLNLQLESTETNN